MHKKILGLLFLSVIIGLRLTAQIPNGYYDDAAGKTGEELKQALNTIIKGHIEKSYGDTRYILDETDVDPNNSDNVLVIYSNHSVSGEWDAGSTWNREHVWAKSRGIGSVSNSTRGAGSDLHNLRACIPSINSARNNRWFAECSEPYQYNGTNTGSYTSSTNWFWKPRDEDKGDVARIIFYMSTRYEGEGDEPDLEAIDYIPADKYTTDPIHALLADLIKWHNEDPVSDFEQHRNNVIYSYQNNRNPFIDHPEYVGEIWQATGITYDKQTEATIYPNPATNTINIRATESFGHVAIINFMGAKVKEFNNADKAVYIGDLPNGHYIVVLQSKNTSITLPLIIVE